MSGCLHPISFQKDHFIEINALQYLGILGSPKARILVNSNEDYSPGDKVTLIEVSVNECRPTGMQLIRYVHYVESRVPLYGDDDCLAICLIPRPIESGTYF